MQSNRLQLHLPRSPLLVDGTPIDPVQSVRDLGIFIAADLVMRTNAEDSLPMPCLCQAAAFYPTLCTNDYVPDSYRLTGTIEAGLRKCHFGHSSGLPSLPTSVDDERGSTAHLRSASHRPHLRCTYHPSLTPSPGEGIVQGGQAHVQGFSCSRAAIPESAGSCRRSPLSALSLFCSDRSSAGAIHETVYHWRPGLPSRRTDHLEQSAGKRDICSVSFYLLSKHLSSWPHFLTLSMIPLNHSPTFSGS